MLVGCSEKTPAPTTKPTPSLPRVEFEAPERKIPSVIPERPEPSDEEKKKAIRRVFLLNEMTSAEENERACIQLLAVASKEDARRLGGTVADELMADGRLPAGQALGLTPRTWARVPATQKREFMKTMADAAENVYSLCRRAVGF